MPHRLSSRWRALAFLGFLGLAGWARAGEEPAPVRPEAGRRPLRRPAATAGLSSTGPGWGWPLAGITAVLAGLGWASLAARRSGLAGGRREAGPLRVVGRTTLGPKQAVYLLRAGDRVLIVGTGPAGPPALLGTLPELDDSGPMAGGGA